MKPNNLLLLLLSMLMALGVLSGCGANISKAPLSGGKVPFETAMTKWASEQEIDADSWSEAYEWQEGWSGSHAPVSPVLSKDEEKTTFIFTLVLSENGVVDEVNHIVFYFIHNTKTNTLTAKGGYIDEDGYIYDFDAAETAEMMDAIYH